MSGKITLFLGHFPRIREDRRRKKKLKFGPFSALFVRNRPKFGRRIVWLLHFLFGPFWLMRPNNRPVGPSHIVCWMWRTKMPRQDIVSCKDDSSIYSELHSYSVSSSRSSVSHRRWIRIAIISETTTCNTKNAGRLSLAYFNATCMTIIKSHILNSFSLHCPAVLGRDTDERWLSAWEC